MYSTRSPQLTLSLGRHLSQDMTLIGALSLETGSRFLETLRRLKPEAVFLKRFAAPLWVFNFPAIT